MTIYIFKLARMSVESRLLNQIIQSSKLMNSILHGQVSWSYMPCLRDISFDVISGSPLCLPVALTKNLLWSKTDGRIDH